MNYDLKKNLGRKSMIVKIFRYNPEEQGDSYYQEYSIPLSSDGTYTIMDLLDYIYTNLDNTISYYRHSICNQGICGRCVVKVNGSAVLACTHRVVEDFICIEPKNNNCLKDLVTK